MRSAAGFDENKSVQDWNPKGIFFIALQHTRSTLFHLDPATGEVTRLPRLRTSSTMSVLQQRRQQMAWSGRSYSGLTEITTPAGQLTRLSDQLKGLPLPTNEVIQWKSKDGATIEGILLKPANYDAAKKYPLLVVIHGGPTGSISRNPFQPMSTPSRSGAKKAPSSLGELPGISGLWRKIPFPQRS